jgi:hypothetical protein
LQHFSSILSSGALKKRNNFKLKMPKFGPDSEVSTLRNPSTHEVNAAVGDIKAAASDSLAPVVGAFAKLAAETDDPVAEVEVCPSRLPSTNPTA